MRLLGEVVVVAPATEQKRGGPCHYLSDAVTVKEVFCNDSGCGDRRWGWAVQGSPADCVKIGVTSSAPVRPIWSSAAINSGLTPDQRAVLGHGAAAIEGAFFGITSVAVSLEVRRAPRFDKAARLAREIIQQILQTKSPEPQLYNLNIPTAALSGTPEISAVP